MKLKFINLILASTLLVGAAQVFTSCKDNESDLRRILGQEDLELAELLKTEVNRATKAETNLNLRADSLRDVCSKIQGKLKQDSIDLKAAIDAKADTAELNKLYRAAGGDINNLVSKIKDINTTAEINEMISAALDTLKPGTNPIDTTSLSNRIMLLQSRLAIVEGIVDLKNENSILSKIQKDAADAYFKAIQNESAIKALDTAIIEINNKFANVIVKDSLDKYVSNLQNQLDDIAIIYATKAQLTDSVTKISKAIVDSCKSVLDQANAYTLEQIAAKADTAAVSANAREIAKIAGEIKDLPELRRKIDSLDSLTSEVNQKLETLTGRVDALESRITSIVVHQGVSPAVGTFNLPVGLTNKMLLAYSGRSVQGGSVDFPARVGETTINGLGLLPAGFTTKQETIESGQWLMTRLDNDANKNKGVVGTVFMTLNPNNVDHTKFNFNLKSSRGVATPVELNVQPSDKELSIGYGRSASNGFYEAVATVEESDVNNIQFGLSQSFKSQVKEILDQPKKLASASMIASLAGSLFNEVNGVLPALAVSATWNEGDKALGVNSEYNLGVATVNPLSFKLFHTLEEQNKFGPIVNAINRIPDISNLPDRFGAMFDDFTGDIKINIVPTDSFKVDYKGIQVKVDTLAIKIPQIGPEKDIVIEVVPKIEIEDSVYVGDTIRQVVSVGNVMNPVLKDIETQIQDQVNGVLKGLDQDLVNLDTELRDMVKSMESQVNDMFKEMNEQVNTQVQQILADIKKKLLGKVTGVTDRFAGIFDRVEPLLDRMKNVLTHPFYYVQPCLYYKNGTHVGLVSTSAAVPSVFTVSGSDAAITLVPSTYTLETAVPCYLKYVGVVKAYANGDKSMTNVESVMKAANDVEYMNEVLPGSMYTVPMKLQKGYTYHVVYQGMDYSGVICGREYYITVK